MASDTETSGNGEATATAARTADVTVVIPCYNQAHYLGECLRSLQAQTHESWEAVVVDDESPDADQIARVIEEVGDDRVRLVSHVRNKGLGGSRNTGIREATTEYVYPLDSDDKIEPICLELLSHELREHPDVDCVYPDCRMFGRETDVLVFPGPPKGGKVLREADTIPGAGTMMRKRLWQRLGGYDEHESLRRGREDFEFWIRAFNTGCTAKRVPQPLYLYRIAHTSMNLQCRLHDDEVAEYIYHKHKRLIDEAGETNRFLCAWYTRAAIATYERGLRGRSFALAWKAWRLSPSRGRLKMILRTFMPRPLDNWIGRGEHRRLIPFLRYPLHGEVRYRPFFVIGAGRSGNTLLRRILTSHSELHIPPETFVLGECMRAFKRYGRRMSWPDLVTLILGLFEFHSEASTFEVQLEPLANRLRHASKDKRSLAGLLDGFYRYHGEQHGVEVVRWGDKTPMNSLDDSLVKGTRPRKIGEGVPQNLERLLKVFPDAQFVHIYRDGCDVVHSSLRGGFFSTVQEAAERWAHTVRQCKNFVARHPDRCHEIRYEELVASPEEVVRGACEFLDVEFEPTMLSSEGGAQRLGDVPAWHWHRQVAEPINARNPGKGRRYMTRLQRRELERLIGRELDALGYPPIETTEVAETAETEATVENAEETA